MNAFLRFQRLLFVGLVVLAGLFCLHAQEVQESPVTTGSGVTEEAQDGRLLPVPVPPEPDREVPEPSPPRSNRKLPNPDNWVGLPMTPGTGIVLLAALLMTAIGIWALRKK